jgi:hypothetical protein
MGAEPVSREESASAYLAALNGEVLLGHGGHAAVYRNLREVMARNSVGVLTISLLAGLAPDIGSAKPLIYWRARRDSNS